MTDEELYLRILRVMKSPAVFQRIINECPTEQDRRYLLQLWGTVNHFYVPSSEAMTPASPTV